MKILTAYYPLEIGPVSYDFVVWLVKAEMARVRAKCDKLHAVIVPFDAGVDGMFRDKTALYSGAEMMWRLWNICVPACMLLGATFSLAANWAQARQLRQERGAVWPEDWDKQTLKNRHHLIGDIITASRKGEPVPALNAMPHARKMVRDMYARYGKPVVTMTLRKTYMGERNSDEAAWAEAKYHIERFGYAVYAIEDTSVALEQGAGYAELNLALRMACYQEAALNLQANNGSASLCWFSDRPYRMFGAAVTPEEWNGLFVKQGLPLGETWPWAKPQQKLCYGKETAAQIIAEFEQWDGATS